MVDLNEKTRRRLLFLHHLHTITGGNIHAAPMVEEVGQELNWSRDETYEVTDYLEGEALVETSAMESRVSITHKGVREVEAALDQPDKPTHYFPPASNVLIVYGDIRNAPIQQGAHNSTQTISYAMENAQDLRQFLILVKNELPRLQLSPDDRSQAEAEVTTM